MSAPYKILIICISLKKSVSRREHIAQQIQTLKDYVEDLSIDFSFFDAIYGKELAPEYISFINTSREIAGQCKRVLGTSEIGCMLSHMFLWQRLAEGQYNQFDRVIFLEDDVTLNINNINAKLMSLITHRHAFAFLGGHSQQSRRRIRGYTSTDQMFFNMTGPRDLYTAAYAYSMTAETAANFLHKLLKRISYVDDWKYLLADRISTPYYFCFDHEGEQESTIEQDRKTHIPKRNRWRKNMSKIGYDIASRILSFFIFHRIIRLSAFLIASKERGYK